MHSSASVNLAFDNLRPKASIIIPCYNAECWVAQAIQSCLDQTYKPLEIIVVDDGSTDGSLQILQSFGDKIKLELGQNKGGNHARNRGFDLSSGDYIQFLDADDYILPEKIEYQVDFLEDSGADVVYGDWQHRHHLPDGSDYLQDVELSGAQEDVLESLLAGWWVSPACLLFRREAVVHSGGWDEMLKGGQDKDFFISVAMTGASIKYQPGCYSVYRRYGPVTVGTLNVHRWLLCHRSVLEKVESKLRHQNRLSPAYQQGLVMSYFSIARSLWPYDTHEALQTFAQVRRLQPTFRPRGSLPYQLAFRLLGFSGAEKIATAMRRLYAS